MYDPFTVVWPNGLTAPLPVRWYGPSPAAEVNVPLSVPDTLVTVLAAGNLVNSAGAAWCVTAEKPDNKTIDSSNSTLGRWRYVLRIMMQVLQIMQREGSKRKEVSD